MSSTSVVVTGVGAAGPLGLSAAEMWQGLVAGRCGIRPIAAFDPSDFPCKLAGQVPPYKIHDYVPRNYRKAVKVMSRDIELAVIAANDAVASSGLVARGIDPEQPTADPTRIATIFGAGLISCDLVEMAPAAALSVTDGEFDIRKWGHGMEAITPLWMLKYLPNMPASHISIIHDFQGPSNTITCGEASAHLAVGEAAEIIARGAADAAVAGAAETKVNPLGVIRQCLLGRAVTTDHLHAEQACRPFDRDAAGSVFGEAGAIVVLESQDHAAKRSAAILAEIAGFGQSQCVHPAYAKLEPDGYALRIAIGKAIAQAAIEPGQIDLVIPHGTGIPDEDLAEAIAIEAALGHHGRRVPVWPTKSMLSNTGAACAGLDLIAGIYAIRDGIIPAARNCPHRAAGCSLNIVAEKRHADLNYVLCCSYTFGGQTAAILLKRPDRD